MISNEIDVSKSREVRFFYHQMGFLDVEGLEGNHFLLAINGCIVCWNFVATCRC